MRNNYCTIFPYAHTCGNNVRMLEVPTCGPEALLHVSGRGREGWSRGVFKYSLDIVERFECSCLIDGVLTNENEVPTSSFEAE